MKGISTGIETLLFLLTIIGLAIVSYFWLGDKGPDKWKCIESENKTVFVQAFSENEKYMGKVPITAEICIREGLRCSEFRCEQERDKK